jgi:hypothetical protein
VFHMDVAKIDRNVVYVAMAIHVCCKRLFQIFHMFFRRMLQVCLFVCCICFIHMLRVFYPDVAYVLYICCECFIRMLHMFSNGFSSVFASISDACFKCFICLQTHIANVHLDVSKVDQVLHILQWHQC